MRYRSSTYSSTPPLGSRSTLLPWRPLGHELEAEWGEKLEERLKFFSCDLSLALPTPGEGVVINTTPAEPVNPERYCLFTLVKTKKADNSACAKYSRNFIILFKLLFFGLLRRVAPRNDAYFIVIAIPTCREKQSLRIPQLIC